MKSACRKYTKHREDQKKALPVGFVGVDGGAGDLDWVVQGEVAPDCWESQGLLGEEDVSWEEAFESFRGGPFRPGMSWWVWWQTYWDQRRTCWVI